MGSPATLRSLPFLTLRACEVTTGWPQAVDVSQSGAYTLRVAKYHMVPRLSPRVAQCSSLGHAHAVDVSVHSQSAECRLHAQMVGRLSFLIARSAERLRATRQSLRLCNSRLAGVWRNRVRYSARHCFCTRVMTALSELRPAE